MTAVALAKLDTLTEGNNMPKHNQKQLQVNNFHQKQKHTLLSLNLGNSNESQASKTFWLIAYKDYRMHPPTPAKQHLTSIEEQEFRLHIILH